MMLDNLQLQSQKARSFLTICWLGILLVTVLPVIAGATPRAASPAPVVGRTSKSFHFAGPWRAMCGTDSCGVPTIIRFAFDTPTDQARVDIDVALSLNFKVSRGDKILVDGRLRQVGGEATRFSPGAYPLTSPSPRMRTSTTLDWTAKGLEANGSRYVIEVSVNPRHGKRDLRVHASGTKALLTLTEQSSTG